MKSWITATCSTALLALAGAANPTLAQQTQAPSTQQSPPAMQRTPSTDYSDAQLEKFVGASKKISLVVQEYNPKLKTSQNENARVGIAQEANKKMVDVVHSEGMTVDEFNTMSQAIQQDPTLLKRAQNLAKSSK